jgi:hypothetical protein
MFFSIQKKPNTDFPNRVMLSNGLWLNMDNGWRRSTVSNSTVYSKGYADNGSIPMDNKTHGNYVAIIDAYDVIKITNDIDRGTPLNLSTNPVVLTNLPLENSERIWADCNITITRDMEITRTYDNIDTSITDVTRDDALEKIDQILSDRVSRFLSNNSLPIKIFLSGGLDTMLVYSYLKRFTDTYELCDYEHIDLTHFYTHKIAQLQSYWGYRQIHHWREPCVLVTGACGDEFMLRSPSHMMLFLMHWKMSPEDILEPSDHHYKYLSQYQEKYKKQKSDKEWKEIAKDYAKICHKVIHMNLNDNQHWHLENTLTFTPLKDIEITKTLMGLPREDLIDQLKNGALTRELISRNDESLLQYLSNQKNNNNQENLSQLYELRRSSRI